MRQPLLLRNSTLAAALVGGALWSLVAFAATPAAAQEAPARFLIERIVVEGLEREAARQIVLAESLLEPGRSYTEADLRGAVHRVNRLPFVVDADMALRRGSERGSYELVITVEAARPFFYGVDLVGGYAGGRTELRLGPETGRGATVGMRKFVGSRGVLFGNAQAASWSSFDGRAYLQLGYTRHGVFAGSGFATVAVTSSFAEQSDYGELQASLEAGLPIGGDHALRGGLSYTRVEDTVGFFPVGITETREDSWEARLAWIRDSTDDPLAPTQGSRFTLAGEYDDRRRDPERGEPALDPSLLATLDSNQLLLRLEGRAYRPLTARQTLGVIGYAWYTSETVRQVSLDDVEDLVGAELLHATSLRGDPGERGDLRLEAGLGLQRLHQDQQRFDGQDEFLNALVRASLVFRHEWGLVRVSLMYVEDVGGND